ncbi:Glutathione S-transferase, C-terminal [Penicillium expansum]|uniref:Glutathione S-transferase, C-terminal n=1 Tax=Penicillium expansum TaxID=27334 RepID=A0A0A2I454_PENEN|nr:Glutathione S-transferase, C-terminal [Penicillium expansum]KGO37223.1 Glutathione S-transferase, C-terminal [Penicillium expansum]KGO61531.1 Glutathione S-transferase, C-terminal [Penicillium expansum]KGO71648.1 Glutathione S-transferase, C-terminal [Penicillium expansum]
MTESKIHFFDLLSDLPGPSKSWSPYTLRTRMVLNFKGIPYTQSWVSYPDIEPFLKAHGVTPGKGTPYTMPAISHKGSITSNPDGVLMDSQPIAEYIDKLYPSPPLFPSGDASYSLFIAVEKFKDLISPSFRSLIVPNVPPKLDERGREYFIRTRSAAFGKPLSEVRPTDETELLALWQRIEKEAEMLIEMLKGKDGKKGPFLEGERAGYADIVLASLLAWFQRFDQGTFEKILDLGDGEFKAFYEACLPWLEGQGEEKEWPVSQ